MIPSDFSDYFKNCSEVERQIIVEELLAMSLSEGEVKDDLQVEVTLSDNGGNAFEGSNL